MKRLLFAVLAVAALAGIAAPGMASAAIDSPGTICGSRTAQVHDPKDTYYNVFNAPVAANQTCVRVTPGQSTFTITRTDQHEDWGYPNISSGWESGEYSCADAGGTCFRYPVREDEDGHPITSLGVAMHGDGDAAYDIWFDRSDSHPVQDNGTEVMIWLRHPGVARGPSTFGYVGEVSIEGVSWYINVWRAHNASDGVSWNYVDYTAVNQRSNLHDFWLDPLFENAEAHGDLSADWYLTAIDAGFELTSGGTGSVASMMLRGVA